MKFFLLVGGTCGFLLSFAAGLFAGNDTAVVLRDSALGCLAGAFLMKGFSAVFLMSVKGLAAERVRERLQREEEKI